jgi:2-polyprenyl-3-methyl-5-hydroxy-6-metoxy-1,4-benzoquinol methylase
MIKKPIMRAIPKSHCIACDSEGTYLYKNMPDRLFGVIGTWNIRQCNQAACGTLWLDPAPIPEDLHIAYQEYYTHDSLPEKSQGIFKQLTAGYRASRYNYLSKTCRAWQRYGGCLLGLFTFFREPMDYPFVYFKGKPKGKLLELGVGSGSTLKLFAEWGWNTEGLDFDAQAVKNAVSKGLKVNCGDLFSQNYRDNQFDAIFSSHVLEHVPDPVAVLKESLRIMKPGGVFVGVTPNKNSRLHKIFKTNWRELDPPRHLYIFTANALQSMAEQAEFSRIEIKSSNYSAAGGCFVSYKIAKYGKTKMGEVSAFKYIAQLARLLLNISFRFSPLSGEELILIAYK